MDDSDKEVVYGEVDGRVAFLPLEIAELFENLYGALASKTWGELRREMAALGVTVSAEESWFDEDDPPADDDPFDVEDAPGYADGDWPPMPQQTMLEWMPEQVGRQFGEVRSTVFNGLYLEIPEDQMEKVAAALSDLGYNCRRDDDLIFSAFRM